MAVEEGKKAPAFTLTDEGGAKRALKDFAGKVVKHWKRVPNAATHPEKVLQVLDERSG